MVDQDHLDRFEEVFKTSLSDKNVKENWDAPSADVWDKIEPRIEKRKRALPLRFAMYAAASAALLFGAYSLVYGPQSSLSLLGLNDVEHKPFQRNKKGFSDIEASMYGYQGKSEADYFKEQPIVASGIQLFFKDEINALTIDNLNDVGPYTFGKRSQLDRKKNTLQVLGFSPSAPVNVVRASRKNYRTSDVHVSELKQAVVSHVPEKAAVPYFPAIEKDTRSNVRLLNYGFFGNTFAANSNYNSSLRDLFTQNSFAVNEHYGFTFGGKMEFQVKNNFSIEAGLGYSRTNYNSGFNGSAAFSTSQERLSGTSLVSSFNNSINTGYGTTSTQYDLTRSTNAPLLDQDVAISGNTRQKIHQLSVPVNLKMAVAQTDKVIISPVLGAQANILLSNSVELTELNTSHKELSVNNAMLNNASVDGLNQVAFDVTMGVDFNVPLSSTNSIEISPFYSQNVTPTFETNGLNNRTSTVGLSLGVSLNKK